MFTIEELVHLGYFDGVNPDDYILLHDLFVELLTCNYNRPEQSIRELVIIRRVFIKLKDLCSQYPETNNLSDLVLHLDISSLLYKVKSLQFVFEILESSFPLVDTESEICLWIINEIFHETIMRYEKLKHLHNNKTEIIINPSFKEWRKSKNKI